MHNLSTNISALAALMARFPALHATHPARLKCTTPPFSPVHKANTECSQPLCDQPCTAIFHLRFAYTFLSYTVSALYAPLYIAGPKLACDYFIGRSHSSLRFSVLLHAYMLRTSS